jgi:cytochrome P450 family 49 subfamily A
LEILYNQWRHPHLEKYHHLFGSLFDRHGDIFRFRIPGIKGHHVFIRDPQDIKTLLAGDGKMPIEPGFDFFVMYRTRLRRDLYPGSGGLLGAHGQPWYDVRSAVQQDMLRPKSALYYLPDIGRISSDLVDLIDHQLGESNNNNGEIANVTPLMYRWALEASGAIFLDSRLGCLEPHLAKDSDAQTLIDSVDLALGDALHNLVVGIPFHKLFRTKHLRVFDEASEKIHGISKAIIERAIARSKASPKTDEAEMSVLEKLIKEQFIQLLISGEESLADLD